MDGKSPLQTINIHDHLRHKLCDLYESDCIFDKFECTFSGDGNHALTGSYNNNFMIYPTTQNQGTGGEILLQADKSAFKAKKTLAAAKKAAAAARGVSPARQGRATPPPSALSRNAALDVDNMDFNKKILHLSWHPYEDTVAIAATNNVSPPSPFPFFSIPQLPSPSLPVYPDYPPISLMLYPPLRLIQFCCWCGADCSFFCFRLRLREVGFWAVEVYVGWTVSFFVDQVAVCLNH
jgi:hypothetical protein